MPSIAEMLVGSALENSTKVPDYAGSLQKGMQLGLQIQETKLNRQKLEQTKAEHSLQKYSKVTDLIKIAHESKDPAIANSLWKYAIPKTVRALGADDAFTDEFLETAAKSPETREKVLGYQLEIQQKIAAGMPASEAVAEILPTISDPAARAALDTDRIIKAQEVKAGEDQANKRNTETAQAALGKQIQAQQETGNVEIRKKTGATYAAYESSGGKSGVEKNIAKYEEAIKKLKEGKVKLGTLAKNVPYGSSEEVLARIDPAAKAMIDDIRGGVNLRATLADPNPTAAQINAVMSRTIDPRLSNDENIKKLEASVKEMKDSTKNAENQFIQQGFMKPEQKASTDSWKKQLGGVKDGYQKLAPKDKDNFLKKLSEKLNVPLEQLKKELGG